MPYPVPPPELPAIVKVLSSEEVTLAATSSNQTHLPIQISSPALTAQNISPPESSPLTAATSAALLGPPISVGYPIYPAAERLNKEELIHPSGKITGGRGEAARDNFELIASLPGLSSDSGSPGFTRLLTQERGGELREFQIPAPLPNPQPLPEERVAPTPTPPAQQPSQRNTTPVQTIPLGFGGVIELKADRQEYDAERQVITAEGNVVMRFQQAVLNADRLQVNLPNRVAIAQGNVVLARGQQLLRGDRFEYYFVQNSGVISNASGEFYQPTASSDFSINPLPTNGGGATGYSQPLSDRLTENQPLQQITNPGGLGIGVGSQRSIPNQPRQEQGGTINRVRYQAERVDFDAETVRASKVRITNDPFSPPELELRADTANFTRVSSLLSEITASRPRLVFDQGFEVPLLRNRITIDGRSRDPAPISFGYDDDDRGGLFAERSFEVISTPGLRFSVKPQYFLQKAVEDGNYLGGDAFGVIAKLDSVLTPRTTLQGSAVLNSLDFSELSDKTRASLRLRQTLGTTLPHVLNLEYSYRDRLFNGSLGFQTVRSSLGAVLTSPSIPLGQTGISLNYQAGAQLINAETDRLDLLKPNRENNRLSLSRYQASASLNRGFLLLQGQGLPATPTEGLRYTPAPVVPYLQLNAGVTGVATGYSSGDTQNSISGNIGLQGQIGHFSRPYLDYTGFNINYYQVFPSGESPFRFDRAIDNRVISGGIVQQIYGPFRLGFQTSVNLDKNDPINTDYFLQYSRRTYNLLLRYNPVLEIGSISFRINDFNWVGNADPFSSEVRPVMQGVTR